MGLTSRAHQPSAHFAGACTRLLVTAEPNPTPTPGITYAADATQGLCQKAPSACPAPCPKPQASRRRPSSPCSAVRLPKGLLPAPPSPIRLQTLALRCLPTPKLPQLVPAIHSAPLPAPVQHQTPRRRHQQQRHLLPEGTPRARVKQPAAQQSPGMPATAQRQEIPLMQRIRRCLREARRSSQDRTGMRPQCRAVGRLQQVMSRWIVRANMPPQCRLAGQKVARQLVLSADNQRLWASRTGTRGG